MLITAPILAQVPYKKMVGGGAYSILLSGGQCFDITFQEHSYCPSLFTVYGNDPQRTTFAPFRPTCNVTDCFVIVDCGLDENPHSPTPSLVVLYKHATPRHAVITLVTMVRQV